jgi:hypothetical protein
MLDALNPHSGSASGASRKTARPDKGQAAKRAFILKEKVNETDSL